MCRHFVVEASRPQWCLPKTMSANNPRASGQSIVLIGLMGAGKTSVGRKLATSLELSFVDADEEIVKAAGCSIEDIFKVYGEQAFREVEARVIARLLSQGPQVLATGGGAYLDASTRDLIDEKGIVVWLRADLDVLHRRTCQRGGRPLLKSGNPRETLQTLINERYPIYGKANIIVDTDDESVDVMVVNIIDALPPDWN